MVGLFPPPANPAAYLHGSKQTKSIPYDLPYGVLAGRCDDDAGYQPGQYTLNAAVQPERTAPAVLGILPEADHIMLNTAVHRDSGTGFPDCPRTGTARYRTTARQVRTDVATWTADLLDVFTGRAAPDGPEAQRAGLVASHTPQIPSMRVELIPPDKQRTTIMLPLAGALGGKAQPGPLDAPGAGAAVSTTYAADGLHATVCLAGGTPPAKAEEPACAYSTVEQPGNRGVLYLNGTGSWTATLAHPVSGTLLMTVAANPKRQPATVKIITGSTATELGATALATPAGKGIQRAVPVQVRIPVTDLSTVKLEVIGAVYVSDLYVAD
jgi:hypothetical protein